MEEKTCKNCTYFRLHYILSLIHISEPTRP